jgi:hypothetical protein
MNMIMPSLHVRRNQPLVVASCCQLLPASCQHLPTVPYRNVQQALHGLQPGWDGGRGERTHRGVCAHAVPHTNLARQRKSATMLAQALQPYPFRVTGAHSHRLSSSLLLTLMFSINFSHSAAFCKFQESGLWPRALEARHRTGGETAASPHMALGA